MNEPKEDQPQNPKEAAPLAGEVPANPPEKKELTPEEQMALYEEDLKETDWGHQPC